MQYTVRTYFEGRDKRIDGACRTFCSMERSAYNLLRDRASAATIKATLRGRYGIGNARWVQSAINQARAVMSAQQEGIAYRVEMYLEKTKNTREKMERLSNPLKIEGCERKIAKLQSRIDELTEQLDKGSYPRAVFGSKRLLSRLSTVEGRRREELAREWREKRSNHFFSVGQANQRGNANTRLTYCSGSFRLEVRNWPGGDFSRPLRVSEHWAGLLDGVVDRADSVRLGGHGELLEGSRGRAYSVRVVLSEGGYQVLVSFEVDQPTVEWTGRLAGIDVNPEGAACTIVSRDGNLLATRFFKDNKLIMASKNKRKWVLEDTVKRMLRWCRDTYRCNAVAVEDLRLKGAYDRNVRTNFKLSNFMKNKMTNRIRLSALKMGMISVEVDSAYSSMVALAKYARRFGGFNRHQLAAFVIGRRALGYGEAPALDCLPKTRRERTMWNRSVSYYGYMPRIQTLPRREPLERKNGGDANGGGAVTKLLTAPPAITPARGSSHSHSEGVTTAEIVIWRAGRARPNGQASRGDGARGHSVSPPDVDGCRSADVFPDREDNDIR